jgi:hypothetical protein
MCTIFSVSFIKYILYQNMLWVKVLYLNKVYIWCYLQFFMVSSFWKILWSLISVLRKWGLCWTHTNKMKFTELLVYPPSPTFHQNLLNSFGMKQVFPVFWSNGEREYMRLFQTAVAATLNPNEKMVLYLLFMPLVWFHKFVPWSTFSFSRKGWDILHHSQDT